MGNFTNLMTAGARMNRGDRLNSASNRYYFTLEGDNQVKIYKTDGNNVIWAGPVLYGIESNWVTIQNDGNLVAYCDMPAGPIARWSTGTADRGDDSTILIMQDNGNLEIWSTGRKSQPAAYDYNAKQWTWAAQRVWQSNSVQK